MLRDYYTQAMIEYDIVAFLKRVLPSQEVLIQANYFDEFIEIRMSVKSEDSNCIVVRVFQMDRERFFRLVEKSRKPYTLTEQRYY